MVAFAHILISSSLYLELFSSDTGSVDAHSDFTRPVIDVKSILIAVVTDEIVPQLSKNDPL